MTGHLCEFFYFLFFKLSFPYCILPCVFQTSHHNAPHDQPVFILCRFHSFKLRLQISFPYSPSSSPPEQRLQCFLVEIYAHTYSFDKSESPLEHVSSWCPNKPTAYLLDSSLLLSTSVPFIIYTVTHLLKDFAILMVPNGWGAYRPKRWTYTIVKWTTVSTHLWNFYLYIHTLGQLSVLIWETSLSCRWLVNQKLKSG